MKSPKHTPKSTKAALAVLAGLYGASPVDAQQLQIVNYESRKAEMENYKAPEFGQSFQAPIGNAAKAVLKGYGEDKKAGAKLVGVAGELKAVSGRDQVLSWAALTPQEILPSAEVKPTASQKVTSTVSTTFVTSMQTQMVAKMAFMQQFKSGLKFDFNLAKIFGGGKTEALPTPSGNHDTVRYGLILETIEPDKMAPKSASLGAIQPEDLAYAGKARPVYRIGPIYENNSDPMFNLNKEMEPNPEPHSNWSWIKKKTPSPKFQGAVLPRDEDPNAAVADNGAAKKLPPMKFSLFQEDKFYTYNYETTEGIKKDKVTHVMMVPIYHTFKILSERNEGMQMTKTTLGDVLVYENKPSLNLSYLNLEKRYQAELKYNTPLLQVGFTADTPPDFKPHRIFKQEKEKYQVTMNKLF